MNMLLLVIIGLAMAIFAVLFALKNAAVVTINFGVWAQGNPKGLASCSISSTGGTPARTSRIMTTLFRASCRAHQDSDRQAIKNCCSFRWLSWHYRTYP